MIRAVLAALLIATPVSAQNVVRSGNYVVYSWTPTDRLAQRVIDFIEHYDSFPALPATAPSFGQPIEIYLTPDDRTFREVTGGRAPEWGAGVALPEQGIIVLRAYGGTSGAFEQLRGILHHELAHVALQRYLQPARIPRWFNEGYAMWSSGELDFQGGWVLRVAFATDRAPRLDSLELAWPGHAVDARVAYLLAASVVQYLVAESGTRGLEVFLRRWRDTHSFESALASTYGLSIDQLEAHWKKDVKRRYGWLAVVTQTSVAFTIIAIGVVALYVIRRRRDRAKLERLRANELPDEPAFWNGIDQAEPPTDIQDDGQTNDENDDRTRT